MLRFTCCAVLPKATIQETDEVQTGERAPSLSVIADRSAFTLTNVAQMLRNFKLKCEISEQNVKHHLYQNVKHLSQNVKELQEKTPAGGGDSAS